MDSLIYRLLNKLTFCFLFFCSSLYSNWDDEFYQQSIELSHSLSSFQYSSYLSTVQDLVNSITELKQDIDLCNKIGSVPHSQKKNFFYHEEGYVIKKRESHNLRDAYTWELSYIFDLPSLVPPTYAFSISGKKCICQQLVEFHCCLHALQVLGPVFLSKVSLETYWKAHLFAYVLGMRDLSGSNIGVISDRGEIIFFDNERSMFSEKTVPITQLFRRVYVSTAFDWPHYRQAIGRELALSLKQYIESLVQKKEEITLYFSMRGVPEFIEPVLENMNKIEEFVFHPNTSFLDFFAHLYPQIAPGLDELNEIVAGFFHGKVDHGRALYYAIRPWRWTKLQEEKRSAIEKWVTKYVKGPIMHGNSEGFR